MDTVPDTPETEPVELEPRYGSDDYFAMRFATDPARDIARHVFALKRAIGDIPMTVSDPGVARLKLAWWENELVGLPAKTCRHPLLASMLLLPIDTALLQKSLLALVRHVDDEYNGAPPIEQQQYFEWFSSAYGGLYVLFNGTSRADEVMTLAGCIEAARSILNVRAESQFNIQRLPVSLFEAHRCKPEALLDGGASTAVRELVRTQIETNIEALTQALSRPARFDSTIRTLAVLARHALKETYDDGCRVFEHRVELTPLRKLWIAWWQRR